jgi:membrane-associated phospholipid phosphatase
MSGRTRIFSDSGVGRAFVVALIAAGFYCLVFLSVRSGGADSMDQAAATYAASHQTPALTSVMQFLSLLMAGAGLTGFALLAVAVWFLRPEFRVAAQQLAVAVAGGEVLVDLLKLAAHRARPASASAFHLNYSFPSGHAFFAVAVYGVIALALLPGAGRTGRILIVAAYLGLALFTGASRIYLGLHYASDVLAGCCAGVAFLALCRCLRRSINFPKRPTAKNG